MTDPFDDDLREIWQRIKPLALQRCDDLLDALSTGDASGAKDTSHKLAGSLGLYSVDEASALAQRIDALVVRGVPAAEIVPLVGEMRSAIEDER